MKFWNCKRMENYELIFLLYNDIPKCIKKEPYLNIDNFQ